MATVSTQNDNLVLYSGNVDTAPDTSTAIIGTVTIAADIVIGVGTTFTTDFNVGDYVFNGTTEVRKVISIYNDTLMYLLTGFSVALPVGSTIRKTKSSRWQQVGYLDVSGGGGKINGVTLGSGEYNTFDATLFSGRCVQPFVVDSTGGNVHISKLSQGSFS